MRAAPASALCESLAFDLRPAECNPGSFAAGLLPSAWKAQMLHAFDGSGRCGVYLRPTSSLPNFRTLPVQPEFHRQTAEQLPGPTGERRRRSGVQRSFVSGRHYSMAIQFTLFARKLQARSAVFSSFARNHDRLARSPPEVATSLET
jgi:hypothetical protein